MFDYFQKYNYEVRERGEVITFAGNYKASRGQAAALVFYVFFGEHNRDPPPQHGCRPFMPPDVTLAALGLQMTVAVDRVQGLGPTISHCCHMQCEQSCQPSCHF